MTLFKSGSTQRVLDAVQSLRDAGERATRESISTLTGDAQHVTDDRLKVLVDEGLLRRVSKGVFEAAEQHPPPRPISVTWLPSGVVKIEIGDDLLSLTPAEHRALGSLTAGAGLHALAAGHSDVIREQMAVMTGAVHRMSSQVAKAMGRLDAKEDASP